MATYLYGLILPKRPPVIVEKYKEIWLDEGSPLLHYSNRQAKLIQQEMESRFKGPVFVEPAMRYGKPSIESGLKALQEKGAHRILVLPLYPQYSATTTATGFDEIAKVLRGGVGFLNYVLWGNTTIILPILMLWQTA